MYLLVWLSCWSLFQIKGMKERLDFWCDDVKNMAVLVEQQAHDILTWARLTPSPQREASHICLILLLSPFINSL